MAFTTARIAELIDGVSVAALRSWLKSEGFERTATSRDHMVRKLASLMKKGELSEGQLEDGISSIEEASSKRVFLFRLSEIPAQLQTETAFTKHLGDIGKMLSKRKKVAPKKPHKITLVYITYSQGQIRAKWAETQTRIEAQKAVLDFVETDVTRIIALVADLATGLIQLRYDKAEDRHQHENSKEQYFSYYRQVVSELLGVDLSQFETRQALRSLVETTPRIVRIRTSSHLSETGKVVRFVAPTAKSDVRDDPEWQAAEEVGGASRVYEDQAFYWLPSASGSKLSREMFTAIDARTSMVRVEADCHELELQYAVSRIREHQIEASTSS